MASDRKVDFDLKWAKAISDFQKQTDNPPVGDGWLSSEDFAKKHKIGRNTAYAICIQGFKNGTMEKHIGTKREKNGKCYKRVWYRPKE
jgi:hypothetical protein